MGGCRNHCQPSPRWMAGGRLPTPSAQIPVEHLCLSAGGCLRRTDHSRTPSPSSVAPKLGTPTDCEQLGL